MTVNIRVHDKELAFNESLPQFCADIPGGYLLQCSACGHEHAYAEGAGERCENCLKWFVYRPWWEW